MLSRFRASAERGGFGITQTGTIVGDPGFWDAAHLDHHLAPGSPCIDAGVGLDLDGSPADIGALAYDATYATGPTAYCAATARVFRCTGQRTDGIGNAGFANK